MINTAIVILNWNGKPYLEKYLPSVILHSKSKDIEIYVIDNGSTDDSIQFLQSSFDQIKIIKLDKNYGFAGGYNRGLKAINAKYYLILNSDVEVTKAWLEPLIKCLDEDEKVAACMPKIKSYLRKDHFEYAGAAGGFIDYLGYPFCQGRMLNTVEKDNGQYNQRKSIFWASGACMLIKSDLFYKAGAFDDDFFAHMEEIDLCWRLKNIGYKIYYVPDSKVYHLGGGTLPKTNPRKTFLNFRNNYYLLFKNLSILSFIKVYLIRLFYDLASFIYFLFELKIKDALAIPKAHFILYFSIFKLLSKKRGTKEKINKRNHTEMYQRSIIIDYYLKKKKSFSDLNIKQNVYI